MACAHCKSQNLRVAIGADPRHALFPIDVVMKATGRLRPTSFFLRAPRCLRRPYSSLQFSNGPPRAKLSVSHSLMLGRHASTKLRKSLDELPQGLQAPLEPFVEKEASKYSPVIDEVLQNQRRFPKCVLLTRVGQFYEVPELPVPSRMNANPTQRCTLPRQKKLLPCSTSN